ncbi:hypothetical protein ACFXJ8_35710 [Nonomuraea sp. NPDC059194]|uniref:hypothetical protein n=1 Tax=Nonomuraea sp. NPDC059194 TaxID=3346764 RepID=UPI003695607D
MPEVEIAGARRELKRAVTRLGEQIVWFAAHLVPGPAPRLRGFEDLWTADPWTPDGRYCALSGRLPRLAEQPGPGFAERAVTLLESAGWTIAEADADSERYEAVVTGRHEGLEVQFRITAREVDFYGRTPVTRLYEWVSPDPVVTAERVRPGCILCPECDGLGWCPVCEGRIIFPYSGYYTGYRSGCPDCLGDNACLRCRGTGQVLC